ncbi:hypothetical protein H1R20_g10945, partial [Candolleomyces eurysporus]
MQLVPLYENAASNSASPEKPTERSPSAPHNSSSSWLEKFQLVLVLDLPDPSSSASGNVSKYFDVIYEQIAFTFAAVLFQEQVLHNFVEKECDTLIALQESSYKKEQPYDTFLSQALQTSSIASAMKSVYEGIKSRSIAYISLNAIPLELQLPPHLDSLLLSEGDYEDVDSMERPEDEVMQNWGPDLICGWKLPGLAPWKSLLLLDRQGELEDPLTSLRGGGGGANSAAGGGPGGGNAAVNADDRALVDSLVRFLETASIMVPLWRMGYLLEWDLEAQVYPVVRWLVLHRRAKVVDTINPGLKTIFALPSKLPDSLSSLSAQFSLEFSHPEIPPFPRILAAISSALTKPHDNHFFASVVRDKELIPMYHDVVVWMLKRDLLVTLHLRIRVVATRELKVRVWEEREHRKLMKQSRNEERKRRKRRGGKMEFDEFDEPHHSHSHSRSHPHPHSNPHSHGHSHSHLKPTPAEPMAISKTPSGRLSALLSMSPSKRAASASTGSSSTSATGRVPVPRRPPMKTMSGSSESRKTSISELVIHEEEDSDGHGGADDLNIHTFDTDELFIPRQRFARRRGGGNSGEGSYGSQDHDYYHNDHDEDGEGDNEEDDEEADREDADPDDTWDSDNSSDDEVGIGGGDRFAPSMINDPGRATPRERRWLTAMSDGQEPGIAKRFEQISQYFDGKRSDDEILYRAGIRRRQLREVLHLYEPYLQTFLHPS